MTSIPMTTEYVDVKVKIGAVEFTNEELQIDSIKISNGCYDGSVFGIGNVYIKNANITMNYRAGITKGLSMEIFFEYQGAWISFGKFVVTETPVMSGDKLSVSLESEFGQTVSTSVDFTSTLQEYTLRDIKTKIEEITGKPIIFVPELTTDEEKSFLEKTACFLKNISDYVNQSGIKTGISVRDMLSGIAILFGGNVYEDTNNKIIIKQKTYYKNSNRYVTSDYLDSNYKYSQEIYAVRLVTLTFLPWCLGLFNPPNASGRICTVNYLGEDKVSNTLLASQSSMDGKTPYDYSINCDWIGWTSDGSTFDTNVTPGGRASACLRQGDLMYRTCDMTFVGIDFGWNIAPGNLVKVKVPELENPIDVLCGEISYEWDGGFTTNISCNCNIESNGSYSTDVSTQASAVAAQEGRKTSLELNYADITFSNIKDSTIRGSIFKDGTIDGSKIKDSTITGSLIADSTIKGSNIEEGTITGSKIKAATLTGAKIQDATIGFEKVDTSFIEKLTADKAYIEKLKASIADIGYLTANEADIKYATIASLEAVDGKIDNLQTIAITTNNLSAKVAELGYLNADTADLKYANIELSNIDVANVGTLFANVGLIDRATIVDGHVTGFLDSIEVNANKITAGTLVADRILLKGSKNGLLYALNNLGELTSTTVDTLDGYVLTDRTINADKIVASSITTNELDVDSIFADSAVVERIFAQDITATGIIRGATLVGASVSADRGTIGGFSIFDDCLIGFYDEDGYQYKVDLNTAKSITGKNGGVIAIEAGKYKISSPYNTEHEWYVTYDGYMHAEVGEIAGFTLKDQTLVSEFTQTDISNSVWDFKNEINSKANSEKHFITATRTGHESGLIANKACFGIDGVLLDSFNKGDDYYDKFMHLSTRSLAFGVNSATPYNGSAIAFEIDSGYAPIYGSGEFTINPSCVINVPTTVNNNLTVTDTLNTYKADVTQGIEIYHPSSTPYIDFHNSPYGQGSSDYDFRIILHDKNMLSFENYYGSIFRIHGALVYENGYSLIGCTVTKSGNFTCKKYRDGRLIIEYRDKSASATTLSNKSTEGIYYATTGSDTFPVAFTDVPSVVTGIGVPNFSAPFFTITFDNVSKTGFGRRIMWSSIANYSIPSGTVFCATFTGRWK